MINTIISYIFWILWSIDLLFLSWMTWDELKLKYLSMPIYIPLGFIWLLLCLILKTVIKLDKVSLIMVTIPSIPLLIMIGFMVIIFVVNLVAGPIRWN
jgi:hypothetical protein